MLRRFIKYYKPYRLTFMMDMLASFGISMIGMAYPIITRNMLNDYIPNQKINMVITFGIALLAVYLIRYALRYYVQYYGHVMGVHIQADMRRDLFNKLQSLPFGFYDEHETGKIMSRMTNDLMEVTELAHHGPENIFMSLIMIVFSFIYLIQINVTLTLINFIAVPFLLLVLSLIREKYANASRKARASISEINGALSSSISGIRVTKAFDNADKELEKFEVGNKAYIEASRSRYRYMALFNSSTSFITDIFNVMCLISGGLFLYNGSISFGDYSAFIVSISLFTTPIITLIQFMETFQDGVTGFERFVEIMDAEIETDKDSARDYKELNGDIEFKNVTFSYKGDEEHEVLDNISFKVNKGETVALVGPSGGGKTTICHLLPRFYTLDSGSITIDGIDVTDVTMSSLRNNIGIVQQDVFLFSGSFYDNILYGKLDATYEEVIEAAKKANIYDYVMSLPNGFDTEIGERGVRLSGGQKQRLSIARVFLKNPSILILDEATSALDNTTEVLIQDALNTLKEGRTTIVVAHRLSTIKDADSILVVSNGKILEEGKHDELIKKDNGVYKSLYEAQFKVDGVVDSSIMMQ